MDDNLINYRERIYDSYVRSGGNALAPASILGLSSRAPYLLKLIKMHFPADRSASILELGCGHGAFIYFMQKEGYNNVHGVDSSPDQLAEGKRLGITGLEQKDLLIKLQETKTGTLDAVISFDVIEH